MENHAHFLLSWSSWAAAWFGIEDEDEDDVGRHVALRHAALANVKVNASLRL